VAFRHYNYLLARIRPSRGPKTMFSHYLPVEQRNRGEAEGRRGAERPRQGR